MSMLRHLYIYKVLPLPSTMPAPRFTQLLTLDTTIPANRVLPNTPLTSTVSITATFLPTAGIAVKTRTLSLLTSAGRITVCRASRFADIASRQLASALLSSLSLSQSQFSPVLRAQIHSRLLRCRRPFPIRPSPQARRPRSFAARGLR